MTAIEQAKIIYARNGRDLNVVISNYLDYGYVLSSPDRLILGRPARRDSLNDWMQDNPDTWYVSLAVGKGCIKWFLDQMPFYLPFLAWKRDFKKSNDRLHIWKTDRFLSKFDLWEQA